MSQLTRNGDPRAAQTLKAQLRLRQMILDGELSAGERVPELMLVERTGVSRTPIRAALLRLAEEGLLEPASSGGFVVREFNEADVYDAIDVRGMLEGAAAPRRAAGSGVPRARNSAICATASAPWTPSSSAPTFEVEQFMDFVRLNRAGTSFFCWWDWRAAPCSRAPSSAS